jgi:hypothetical protein
MKKLEPTLEWLLAYDGRVHYFPSGHFVKFEIRLVKESEVVPHGIASRLLSTSLMESDC